MTTGIILAGGKNSRMGRNKAFIQIRGIRIIDNTIDIFKRIFKEVIIVTNNPEDYEYTKLRLVKDKIPDKGSLGGLYSGIEAAKYKKCFVVACDMPYISEELIRYIISLEGYDIVVPKVSGRLEPLFASYTKSCSDCMREQLENNNLKITYSFSKFKVKELNEEKISIYDKKFLSFININTPQELEKILKGYT